MTLHSFRFIWILPLIVAGLTCYHIIAVTNGIPLSDEWRWLKDLLIPYQRGEINFWQYITGEYAFLSHSHYFTLLSMLAVHDWFAMDFAYMAYIGIVAYLATWFLLLMYYLSLQKKPLSGREWLGLMVFTLGYCAPLSDFPWLLVMFEYIYYLVAMGVLCLYDMYLRGKTRFSYFVVAFIFSSILADTPGLMAVLTVLSWSITLSVFRQQPWMRTLCLLGFFILVLLAQYIFLGSGIGGVQPLSKALLALLNDPLGVIHSLLSTFAQPLLDKELLASSPRFKDEWYFWRTLVGVAGLTITFLSLWFYWRAHAWRKTYMPVLLVLFGLVAWATILISRYLDGGPDVFDNTRRFLRFFAVYYIGAGFALAMTEGKTSWRIGVGVLIVLSVCFLYATKAQYQRAVYAAIYFERAEAELKHTPLNYETLQQSIPRCQPGFCEDSINYLRENQLSVFNQ